MSAQTKRPTLIIIYKGAIVLVLAAVALISGFSWRHYDALASFAQTYLAEGEYGLTSWFLQKILHTQPDNLRLIARFAGFYAVALGAATIGLWFGTRWAYPVMIALVSLPIPLELSEAIQHPSRRHVVMLVVNLLVVFSLLRHQFAQEKGVTESIEETVYEL